MATERFDLSEPSPEERSRTEKLRGRAGTAGVYIGIWAKVGPHEYVVRYKTCPEESWTALQEAIQRYGRRERYLVTGNTFTYLMIGDYRYWTAPGWEVINRARQVNVADKYGPPQKESRPVRLHVEFRGGRVVNVDSGEVYDVAAVAARIPWVKFRGETVPPTMPAHWYVVLGRSADVDWDILPLQSRSTRKVTSPIFVAIGRRIDISSLLMAIATGERSSMEHTCSIDAPRTPASRRGGLTGSNARD